MKGMREEKELTQKDNKAEEGKNMGGKEGRLK
jgi:hypothetical protein